MFKQSFLSLASAVAAGFGILTGPMRQMLAIQQKVVQRQQYRGSTAPRIAWPKYEHATTASKRGEAVGVLWNAFGRYRVRYTHALSEAAIEWRRGLTRAQRKQINRTGGLRRMRA